MDNTFLGELATSFRGIVLLALFFGGSIFVHELGHFLAARWRGLKIERFSIGFGPKIFGWTGKDGVDYRVSWIPLGGYVALPQMGDPEAIEGATESDVEKLPEISYADKMIVAVMGAVFNVIFAFALATILWFTGMPVPEGNGSTIVGYVPEQVVTSSNHLSELGLGQTVPGPAFTAGLRSGDEVLAVDGVEVKSFKQINEAVMLGNGMNSQKQPVATFTIKRGAEKLDITVLPARVELNTRSGDKVRVAGLMPRSDVILNTPMLSSPAEKAGLIREDRIIAIDGRPVNNPTELLERLRVAGPGERTFQVSRVDTDGKSQLLTLKVTPKISTRTNPVGLITYSEGEKRHSIVVVPVTRDLLSDDPLASRDQLMVLGVSPEDSTRNDQLRIGTILDKVDGKELTVLRSLDDLVKATGAGRKTLTFYWKRANGDAGNLSLTEAEVSRGTPVERALIGAPFISKPEIAHNNPIELCTHIIKQTFTTLGRLFDRDSDIKVNQLASVISISKTYYNISEDIRLVLWFTVLINLNLAILNLLPIPVLDGGHMLIATISKLTNNALNAKAVTIVQFTCMALILSLMGYIILNDVRRCTGDSERQLKQQVLERHVYRQVDFVEKR
ncbi:putative zinc metalloprotease mll0638 [Verrucomicrobiota bacterium]|nr:putative zinc metalloprotease mll0638 [Verrucomicrobiota bacterium]